jgi:hypothetical protein
MIIVGLLNLLEVDVRIFRDFPFFSFLSGTARALFQIVIGVVCIIGSKFVSNLVWAVVLLVLGILAGTIGGSLVATGAILGLVSVLLKNASK